jgi:hypothetical protein
MKICDVLGAAHSLIDSCLATTQRIGHECFIIQSLNDCVIITYCPRVLLTLIVAVEQPVAVVPAASFNTM